MKTELTQEQKRIKIAEACGWKWEARIKGAIKVWNKPPLMVFHDDELPDYLNDLNAMHEAESRLVDWVCYRMNLSQIVGIGYAPDLDICDDIKAFVSATAEQRAEAFGKTLGLW